MTNDEWQMEWKEIARKYDNESNIQSGWQSNAIELVQSSAIRMLARVTRWGIQRTVNMLLWMVEGITRLQLGAYA